VVSSHLVCDPIIRQPGFDLPRQQWSLLNRFRTEQEHYGACRRKWRLTDTDLCPYGETQTMSHIVESCPLTKLNGGLSRLRSADEDAFSWLTSYGSWNAYEKKKKKWTDFGEIGTSGPQGKGMNRSSLRITRSNVVEDHEIKVQGHMRPNFKFGGLAKAFLSNVLDRVAF